MNFNIDNFMSNIKWSYVIIIVLAIIIVVMYVNKTMCSKNKYENEEGYEPVSINNKKNDDQIIEEVKRQDPSIGEIVLYYATWCGYSRLILPEWDKFEKYVKENIPNLRIRKLKCEGGDERTCVEKGIKGYPTIILYPNNDTEIMFDKERTTDELIKFVKENL